jgi:hypothetical protein
MILAGNVTIGSTSRTNNATKRGELSALKRKKREESWSSVERASERRRWGPVYNRGHQPNLTAR